MEGDELLVRMLTAEKTLIDVSLPVRPGVDYDCNRNRLQSITLFPVIVIVIIITKFYISVIVIVIVIVIMLYNHCNHYDYNDYNNKFNVW